MTIYELRMLLTLRLASQWQKAAPDKEQPGSLKRHSAVERWCRRGHLTLLYPQFALQVCEPAGFLHPLEPQTPEQCCGGGGWGWPLASVPRVSLSLGLSSLDLVPTILSRLYSISGFLLSDNQTQIHLLSSMPFPTLNLNCF